MKGRADFQTAVMTPGRGSGVWKSVVKLYLHLKEVEADGNLETY